MAIAKLKRMVLSPYMFFIVAILIPPLFVIDPFWINRLALYLVFSVLAISMSLCWGYAGILSLGHGVFRQFNDEVQHPGFTEVNP
jgi:urea transport system permease protein